MAFVLADRVSDTSTAQAAGTITLSGTAPSGFSSFSTGVGVGNYTIYCVYDTTGHFEVSYGQLTAATTLTRLTKPISSSNAGNQVAAFSGTVTVILGPEATMTVASLGQCLGGLNNIGGSQRYWTPDWTGYFGGVNGYALYPDAIWFTPIWVGQWYSTLNLRLYISTLGSASEQLRLGWYSHSGGGPLTLLGTGAAINAGATNSGVAGNIANTITLTSAPQPPGLYWSGILGSGANPVYVYANGVLTSNPRIMGGETQWYYGSMAGWSMSGTSHATVNQANLVQRGPGGFPALYADAGL